MTYKFYVQVDGSTFGPYTAKEILSLDLLDDILVTEESMDGQWLQAKEFDFNDMCLKESGIVINDDGSISRTHVAPRREEPREEPYTPTSQDLSNWNWGAFMFNWLWAICNGIYWPLLLILLNFIPYVGPIAVFGICVYLGVKGNEMAWNAKTWPSWESFKETQHKWAVAILWVFGISLLITIAALIA
jgi:hypothetical protein